MLTGKLAKLREYREGDLLALIAMLNDEEVRLQTNRGLVPPMTEIAVKKLFEDNENLTKFHYIITDLSGEFVGFCELNNLFKDRHCQISLQIKSSKQRKGYGMDALNRILNIVFSEMNSNKCSTTIPSFNEAAYSILTKAGFTKEAVLREDLFHKGSYHDTYMMGLLKEEYNSNQS